LLAGLGNPVDFDTRCRNLSSAPFFATVRDVSADCKKEDYDEDDTAGLDFSL